MTRRVKQLFIIFLIIFFIFIQIFTVWKECRWLKDLELHGEVVAVPFPYFGLRQVATGDFQRGMDAWLQSRIGMKAAYIKLENQINYSLFNYISGSPSLVIGKNRWLFEKVYVKSYYKQDVIDVADLEKKIRQMADLQNELALREIPFLFIISPSKVSIYPEYLPTQYAFPHRNTIKSNYENMIPLLNKYKINYLDGNQYYLNLKTKDRMPLFYPGGTHWSYYSCWFFTLEVLDRLEKSLQHKMTRLSASGFSTTSDPKKSDRDIALLTNLIFEKTFLSPSYYYPKVKCDKSIDGYQPRMLAVGGSFMYTIFHYLDECSVYKKRDFYYYYSTNAEYPERTRTPLNKKDIDLKSVLMKNDILVIESNMQMLHNIGNGFIQDALNALRR